MSRILSCWGILLIALLIGEVTPLLEFLNPFDHDAGIQGHGQNHHDDGFGAGAGLAAAGSLDAGIGDKHIGASGSLGASKSFGVGLDTPDHNVKFDVLPDRPHHPHPKFGAARPPPPQPPQHLGGRPLPQKAVPCNHGVNRGSVHQGPPPSGYKQGPYFNRNGRELPPIEVQQNDDEVQQNDDDASNLYQQANYVL